MRTRRQVKTKRSRTCGGKKRYVTEIEAQMVLLRIQSRSTHDTVPIRVYPCPDCHGWHLTSNPKSGKRSA